MNKNLTLAALWNPNLQRINSHTETHTLFSVISLTEWQKCLAVLTMDFKIDLSLEGGLTLTGKMVFQCLHIYVCTHVGHMQLMQGLRVKAAWIQLRLC